MTSMELTSQGAGTLYYLPPVSVSLFSLSYVIKLLHKFAVNAAAALY
jgi:hypothetical protein